MLATMLVAAGMLMRVVAGDDARAAGQADHLAEPIPLPPVDAILAGSGADASNAEVRPAEDQLVLTYPNGNVDGWMWRPHVVRFGWWATSWEGSPAKIGEWQDLEPSPYFDIDALLSNGRQTTNVIVSGTDQETTALDLYHYRPGATAEIEYDRFIHRREHDRLENFVDVSEMNANPGAMVKEDFHAGPDYVVRVQDLKASIKKRLNDNLQVRLDVWGMRKSGTRQASAMADCFHPAQSASPVDGRCHVLTQPQRIDWVTMEIKPVVEWKQGDLSVEYSRPMRTFHQDDQWVTRRFGPRMLPFFDARFALRSDADYAYGVTPENFTQSDRLKLGWEISETNKLSGFLYHGNTKNREIDLHRTFSGADLRWTNRTLDTVTFTPYMSFRREDTSDPNEQAIAQTVPENLLPVPGGLDPALAHTHLIDRRQAKAGLRGVWRPTWGGFSRRGPTISSGYEFSQLEREHADFAPDFESFDTTSHRLWLSPRMRWSSRLESFLRYKVRLTDQPLFGTRSISDTTGGDDLPFANTLLPEQENRIEIGGTWTPSDRVMLTGSIGFEQRYHSPIDLGPDAPFAGGRFVENVFPLSGSTWYQATERWSLTLGAAYFSDRFEQDILLGEEYVPAPGGGPFLWPLNSPWTYSGRAEIYSLGSRYALGERVWLTGDVEYVDGLNTVRTATFSDLGNFSAMQVNTTRLNAGIDWLLRQRISAYFRYILYRYDDEVSVFDSGTSHMFLGGFSATM